jgi:hypothetical protein
MKKKPLILLRFVIFATFFTFSGVLALEPQNSPKAELEAIERIF